MAFPYKYSAFACRAFIRTHHLKSLLETDGIVWAHKVPANDWHAVFLKLYPAAHNALQKGWLMYRHQNSGENAANLRHACVGMLELSTGLAIVLKNEQGCGTTREAELGMGNGNLLDIIDETLNYPYRRHPRTTLERELPFSMDDLQQDYAKRCEEGGPMEGWFINALAMPKDTPPPEYLGATVAVNLSYLNTAAALRSLHG